MVRGTEMSVLYSVAFNCLAYHSDCHVFNATAHTLVFVGTAPIQCHEPRHCSDSRPMGARVV